MRRALCLLVWAVAAASCLKRPDPGLEESQSPRPIPTDGQATAVSDDFAKRRAWYERNFLEGYRKAGRHSPNWDAAAEEFIRSSEDRFLGVGPEDSIDQQARARTLVNQGCDDPAVLFLAALTLSPLDRESRQIAELYERAFVGMRDGSYPRGAARAVATALREDFTRRNEGVGKREALDPVELRLFLESLHDGSYAPDDDAVLVHQIIPAHPRTSFFVRNRATIVSSVQAIDWVDPWARLYLSGRRYVEDAWDARGAAYASDVKQEGWKGFEQSLALARKDLEESWRLRPDRPEAAGRMITVAMAAGRPGESLRLWFDRSVAARVDYMPAYSLLINALRRRWSGDPGALLEFAEACAATRRFDTEVPFQAFEAVEQSERDLWSEAAGDSDEPLLPPERPPSPYSDEQVYKLVEAVLERYRREPARSFEWRRFASLQAAIAYKAGRYEAARDVLHDLGGVLAEPGRDAIDEDVPEARIEAYAAASGSETQRAERLWLEGRSAEARPLFERARASAPVEARPLLDKRLVAIALESDLAAGRSARFLPAPGLAGWTVREGRWEVAADGALVGTGGTRGTLIVADARVGPDFELESDVEITYSSNGQFQAGVVFGRHPSHATRDWASFRLKRTAYEGDVAYFSRHFNKPNRPVQHKLTPRSHLVIQSWDGRLWAYMNGDLVIGDYRPEWTLPRTADVQVGFGAYTDDNVYMVRYRNTRLRRLTAEPRPPRATTGR